MTRARASAFALAVSSSPRLGAALLALAVMPAIATAGGRDPDGRVVFARGDSLWLTDARGKAPAVAIAALPVPATDVRVLRTDAGGTRLLADLGGRWHWLTVPAAGATATFAPLPCAAGPARLSPGGDFVLCATATGRVQIVRLSDGRIFDRDVPIAGAAITERDGTRELVWQHDGGLVAAPLSIAATPSATTPPRVVAPAAPARGLVVSPDGTRAVGIYRAPHPRAPSPRDQLFGFALDGTAARRRLIRDGIVLDWSADSTWLLVQDGTRACIARAVGGEYKCWKNFTPVSISPDGAFALFLGPRDGTAPTAAGDKADAPAADKPADKPDDGEGEGEGEADDTDEPDVAAALPTASLSLFRAKLAGPYTERPALVEKVLDGAAVWLPPAPAAE